MNLIGQTHKAERRLNMYKPLSLDIIPLSPEQAIEVYELLGQSIEMLKSGEISLVKVSKPSFSKVIKLTFVPRSLVTHAIFLDGKSKIAE